MTAHPVSGGWHAITNDPTWPGLDMKYTPSQIDALADAMGQLLVDMGVTGKCVCGLAKANARIAYEPFTNHEEDPYLMPLAEAERIVLECDG